MKAEYVQVSAVDTASDSDEWSQIVLLKQNRRLRLYNCLLLLLIAFALPPVMVLFLINHSDVVSDATCTAQIQGWSPFLGDVEYVTGHLDNEFEHKTKYRGPPTNRLEREWERLWNHDLIAIPGDHLNLLNKSTEELWLEAPGGYAANLDVFHQLHCLNLVRQYTWKDYYDEYPDLVQKPNDMTRAPNDEQIREHVDHCIETLRLTLMCYGDITPYLHVKHSPDDTLGTADFNMNHKCRNFERIVEAYENRAVRERYLDVPIVQYESLVDLP